MRTSLLAATAIALLAGCTPRPLGQIGRASPTDRYTILVDNRSWSDVHLYAMYLGHRTRLTTLPAASRSVVVVPRSMLDENGELQLVGDPTITHEEVRLDPVRLQPGQHVELTLEPALWRSFVAVR